MADEHSPEYLAGFLNSRYGKRVLRGMAKTIIGMANINARELRGIRIPVPPQSTQREFDEAVVASRLHHERLANHLGQLDELFASLRQRAFAGAI